MKSPVIRLSPADYQAFEKYAFDQLTRRSRWFWVIRAARYLGCALLGAGFFGLYAAPSHMSDSAQVAMHVWATLVAMGIGLFLLSMSLMRQEMASVLFGNGSAMLQPFEMSLDAQGIELSSENTHSRLSWAAIEKIDVAVNHAYLFLSPLRASILPASGFENRASFQAFIDEARKLKLASAPL